MSNPKSQIPNTSQRVVWKFTNGRELSKSEFTNYFERKVFRTIRKHQLLPENKIFILKKTNTLNTLVLKKILETKFQTKLATITNTSSKNLSQIAEDIFKKITKGNFNGLLPVDRGLSPLLYLSDKEVELYAKLKNIKGEKRNQNKKIQALFNKFLPKNQDLEVNILKASTQLK